MCMAVWSNAYLVTRLFHSFLPLWRGVTGSAGGFFSSIIPPSPQGQCLCPGSPGYRGRRGASSNERHVLVAWVPTEEHSLVPAGPKGAGSAQAGEAGLGGVCSDFYRRIPGVCRRETEKDHG